MVEYRIVIKDIAGNTLGEIDRFKDLRYKRVLNREGDCSFTVSIKDEKLSSNLLQLGLREVYIYRGDDIAWGGVLIHESGSITGGDDMVTLRAKGFMWYLKKLLIKGLFTYTNTDQIQIAWSLINTAQIQTYGNRGILQGSLPASVIRVSKQFENTSVYDALISLMELQNGFDADVTQGKVFNAYHGKKGTDRSNSVIFSLDKNIARLDFSSDFSDPFNRAVVQGGGFGDAMVTTTRDDTSLQQSYGLYEDFVAYKDVEELTLLQEKGDRQIARRGLPRREHGLSQIPESDPAWNTLDTGDRIRLAVESGYKSLYDSVRIYSIDVGYNEGIESTNYSFIYD